MTALTSVLLLRCAPLSGPRRDEIRAIAAALARCLLALHDAGLAHGNFKPSHCVRCVPSAAFWSPQSHQQHQQQHALSPSSRSPAPDQSSGAAACWRLVDLGSATPMGDDLSSRRLSSGFCPPESLAEGPPGSVHRRSFIEATPAHDLWAFGATLFQLCAMSGEPLWALDRAGDLAEVGGGHSTGAHGQLAALRAWDEAQRRRRLRVILGRGGAGSAAPEARLAHDLLSALLNEDPEKRPCSARDVLRHPFFSVVGAAAVAAAAAALPRHDEEDVAVTRLEARKAVSLFCSNGHLKSCPAHPLLLSYY